jgi:SIR2-like domain
MEEVLYFQHLLFGFCVLPIHDREANSAAKERLIATLRQGRLIGMTGAGLSAWAGYPVWNGALRRLADLVAEITGDAGRGEQVIAQNMDLLFCAQKLGQIIGEVEFSNFLLREFGPTGRYPPNVLLQFASLPLRHIVTLNFDLSCEEAHTVIQVPFQSQSSASDELLLDFFRKMDVPEFPKTIFHLHGQFSDPLDKIALTEVGYQRLYTRSPLFLHHLENLMVSKSILFTGFGFTDSDVVNRFRETARLVRTELNNRQVHYHFAIIGLSGQDGGQNDDRAMREFMSDRYLIDAVFYNTVEGESPHAEFAELMRELAEACGEGVPAAAVLPAAALVAEVVDPRDVQRMQTLNAGFLRRVEQDHEND